MAGLIPEPGSDAWNAATRVKPPVPETDEQRQARWQRECGSLDISTAAVAQYGLKLIEDHRRQELMDYLEDMGEYLDQRLDQFIARGKIRSPETLKAYSSDVASFRRFWSDIGFPNIARPFPGELVAMFICMRAEDGESYEALSRTVAAIDYDHRADNLQSPIRDGDVRAALKYASSLAKPTTKTVQ